MKDARDARITRLQAMLHKAEQCVADQQETINDLRDRLVAYEHLLIEPKSIRVRLKKHSKTLHTEAQCDAKTVGRGGSTDVVLPVGHKPRARKDPGRRAELTTLIQGQKRPCALCGDTDLFVIDFHHNDPRTKRGDVVRMKRELWTDEEVLAELSVCTCLCKTCHMRLHRRAAKGEVSLIVVAPS